jgi:hypothetical protein
MTSHKTRLLASFIAVCALSLGACQEGSAPNAAFSKSRAASPSGGRGSAPAGLEELDLGQDWEAAATARQPGREGGAHRRSSYWTVLLGTYTGPDHEAAAANMVRSCASIDPGLGAARVHTTGKGSMVVFGAHDDPSDPAAQRDLKWVKEIQLRGRQVFPGAMLTRVNVRAARGEFKPHELLSVRRLYPRVNPLYTLEVAIWGDFGAGTPLEEIQRSAERYAAELRGQGYEAYFHHDEDRRLSMVTVGLFDKTAIDPESGIWAPEIKLLVRKFPARLVNGEPLREPVSRCREDLGTRVQEPKLVLVPEL